MNRGKGGKGGAVLHRAPLVVPVDGPVVEDGAVLTCGGKIVAVGTYRQLKKNSDLVVDHEDAVIVPGLINCHSHLELSFLRDLGHDNSFFKPGDITSWIDALVHKRADLSGNIEENIALVRTAVDGMYNSGVVLTADIGNLGQSAAIAECSPLKTYFFMEVFGLSDDEIPALEKRLADFGDLDWTGHALYSTNSELLRRLKDRARSRGALFPIHTAESAPEIEFLQSGTGPFARFLQKRLAETEPSKKARISDIFSPPGTGAICHLAEIGCLDSKTLCVHCVHVDDKEIEILANSGAAVCLCPTSNDYMGVGKAPVGRLVDKGVKLGLGTDSLASTPNLSLWDEMKMVANDNQDLHPESVFRMATIFGAEILGVEKSYGTLARGKDAVLFSVHGLEAEKADVYQRLVYAGSDINIKSICA